MDMQQDILDIIQEWGTWCMCTAPACSANPVYMIVQAGSIHARYTALSFADKSTLPKGSNYGYGLMMADDAPPDMHPEMQLTIVDSQAAEWTCVAAKALTGIDMTTRKAVIIAWRLTLRGKQRMTRGR